MEQFVTLRSEGTARWFIGTLITYMVSWLVLGLDLPLMILYPESYAVLAVPLAFAGLTLILSVLLFLIFHLVWLYRLHKDMKQFWPDYPISPGGAIARTLIPFYNFWGIWNIWKTASLYLPEPARLPRIDKVLPWFYIAMFASNIFNRASSLQPESLPLDLLSTGVTLTYLVLLLFATLAALEGIQQKASEIPEATAITQPY